jgi:hypothetical protein
MFRAIACPDCGSQYVIPMRAKLADYRCSVCGNEALCEAEPPSSVSGIVGSTAPGADNRKNDAFIGAVAGGATGAAIGGPWGAAIGAMIGFLAGASRVRPTKVAG